jgi:hypothetical protein
MLKNFHRNSYMLAVWQTVELYNCCYHFILLCLPLDSVAELTCWISWCALNEYLKNPVDMWTVIVVIRGVYCSQNYITVNYIISVINYKNKQILQPDTASTEMSSTCFFIPFKSLSNQTAVYITPVLIHIVTPHQQMADTLSLLILDPLHIIIQRTVIEITVAGALIMKTNCCNEDCYLLPKDTVMLVDVAEGPACLICRSQQVGLFFCPHNLGSKLILSICNQFIAIPLSHNTTLCCKITTKLLSQQCSLWPLCELEICHTVCLLCCNIYESTWKYSLVVIHMTYAMRAKCSAHKQTVTLLQCSLALK